MSESHLEGETQTGLRPADAFALLGNEIRMGTLQALWESDSRPVPFTTLQERVGVSDRGNFFYHLDQLSDHFVSRTEDGYALTPAGEQIIRAILTGSITEEPHIEPVILDERCPFCGATVELDYTDFFLTVKCTRCPGVAGGDLPYGTYMMYHFPPSGLRDRDPREVISAAHTFYDAKITPMIDGVCSICAGKTTCSIDICGDHSVADDTLCPACERRGDIWATYRCGHCSYARECPIWFAVLNHPAVIGFYADVAGLDQRVPFSKFTWENAPYVRGITTSVRSTDRLEISIGISYEEHELEVIVDETTNVLDVRRGA